MTDEFEDRLRAAGRSIGTTGELPTYHEAWRRGRRRRLVKRGSLAAAGALALVLAFSADLGRLPGGDSVEVDDVASDAIGAPEATSPVFEPTPTAPVPTTEPIETPSVTANGAPRLDLTPEADPSDEVATDPVPTPTATADDEPTPVPEATTDAARTPDPLPTATAPPAATATPPPAAATTPDPTPTEDPRTAAEPEPTRDPQPVEVSPTPEPTAAVDPLDDPGDPNDGTDGTDGGPDGNDGTGATPVDEPPIAVAIGEPAEATILLPSPTIAGARPCDTDGDGEPDARCELLVEYECTSVDQRRPGFKVADLDGDGQPDWCVPDVKTGCDLDGDGLADLACVVRPTSENALGVGP